MEHAGSPRGRWARLVATVVPMCVVPDAVAFAFVGLWGLSRWLMKLVGFHGAGSPTAAWLLCGVLVWVWVLVGALAGVPLYFSYEEAGLQLPAVVALLGPFGQPAAVLLWQLTGVGSWLWALAALPTGLIVAAGVAAVVEGVRGAQPK